MKHRILLSLLVSLVLVSPVAIADEPHDTEARLQTALQDAIQHHLTAVAAMQARVDELKNRLAVTRTVAESAEAEGDREGARKAKERATRLDAELEDAVKALQGHMQKKPAMRPLLDERAGNREMVRVLDVRALVDAGFDVKATLLEASPNLTAIAVEGGYAAVLGNSADLRLVRALLEPRYKRGPDATIMAALYDVSDLVEDETAEQIVARLRRLAPDATIEVSRSGTTIVATAMSSDHALIQAALAQGREGTVPVEELRRARQDAAEKAAVRVAALETEVAELRTQIAMWNEHAVEADRDGKEREARRAKQRIDELNRTLIDWTGKLEVARSSLYAEAAELLERATAEFEEAVEEAPAEFVEWPALDDLAIEERRRAIAEARAAYENAVREKRRGDAAAARLAFGELEIELRDEHADEREARSDQHGVIEQLEWLRDAHRLLVAAGQMQEAASVEGKIADLERQLHFDAHSSGNDGDTHVLEVIRALHGDVRELRTEVQELTGLVRQLIEARDGR